ncbi:MAG: succinylglutamate desuccinylase/aspartoacylase family protein [Bacteroidetes bacterium]|nr:succinylglutamate desuccinylase/aspartoacylase family protein [Bacteroidota bacterium]
MSYTNKVIHINGTNIHPGSSAQVNLNLYQLPTKTIIEIPVYVYRSIKAGPTLLILAGMHGDEINGIEIVRRLITRDDVRNPLCGSIIAIPVINIISFLYGSRDLPDGRDLNRCFPGSRNGSLGSRIAFDLMNEIIPQIDFGIDFHTGGAKINNYPQLRCVFNSKTNLDLGKKFSPPLIVNSPFRDNTLRKEASKKGKSILVFEGGESSRFDYLSINEGMNGCLRLMKHLNMVDLEIPNNPTVLLNKTSWIRAKSSGLFHTSKTNGAHILKGEIIGMICDPYGEHEEKLVAPFDGYILGINNQPVINQGDALMHVGVEE